MFSRDLVRNQGLSIRAQDARFAAYGWQTAAHLGAFDALFSYFRLFRRHGRVASVDHQRSFCHGTRRGADSLALRSLGRSDRHYNAAWLADKFGAGLITSISIGTMAIGGFSFSAFLQPDTFHEFFAVILVICAAAGLGNSTIFKIIPLVLSKEAGAAIGIVSCLGGTGRLCSSTPAGIDDELSRQPCLGLHRYGSLRHDMPSRECPVLPSLQFTIPLLSCGLKRVAPMLIHSQ